MGHYNKQNYRFLEKLKEYYSYIILVTGNHDYYLISKSGLPGRIEAMFAEEKAKLNRILASSDVIVTHIPPDWSVIPKGAENDLANSYY
ncbi:hypothetical protein D3C76_1513890 [compost metagenome]